MTSVGFLSLLGCIPIHDTICPPHFNPVCANDSTFASLCFAKNYGFYGNCAKFVTAGVCLHENLPPLVPRGIKTDNILPPASPTPHTTSLPVYLPPPAMSSHVRFYVFSYFLYHMFLFVGCISSITLLVFCVKHSKIVVQ